MRIVIFANVSCISFMENRIGRNKTGRRHIVVIGGGFAGLNFVKRVNRDAYDVTLIDRNNYHSFPPLFYQVASAGLDPASICFPLRRELRKLGSNRVSFHMGEVERIDVRAHKVYTRNHVEKYDILVIAAGTCNNFFNMPQLEKSVYTLKSVSEALRCRNDILERLERASLECDADMRRGMLNFVVVGGGPTGVEIAGAIGEMKRYVLPREYPSISQDDISITLIEGSGRLLGPLSEESSGDAAEALRQLMVDVRTGCSMKSYDDGVMTLSNGDRLPASMVIWTAGVTGVPFVIDGIPGGMVITGHGNRFITDEYCRVKGTDSLFALGDIALAEGDPDFPKGHPQLAQPAIQQGRLLAENLNRMAKDTSAEWRPFRYRDKGSMATIGRNRAVVDMRRMHLNGFPAWLAWMFVHLISLLGMRNKLTVLINWIWAYFNYGTSLRLLIYPARSPRRSSDSKG